MQPMNSKGVDVSSLKEMTSDELGKIALRLSHNWFIQHWLHWNYPSESPVVMAMEARDSFGENVRVDCLLDGRLTWSEEDKRYYVRCASPRNRP